MSNDVVIEAWNTVLFEKFSRFKYLFIEGYASISEEALKRSKYPEGSTVLDVGCGFGDCTIEIAKSLGNNGIATGVDCASNFIGECRKSAKDEAAENAKFFVADVEVDDLGDVHGLQAPLHVDAAQAAVDEKIENHPDRGEPDQDDEDAGEAGAPLEKADDHQDAEGEERTGYEVFQG